jgi:pyruvate-ferredoxin/flavodoxin oxidoreductase
MPQSVKRIAVLDRTKEPGANGEPLYLDVKDLFYGKSNAPMVVGGRYGLSSKDTTPAQILAVFENLSQKEPKNGFTIGIVDDVSFKSLPVIPEVNVVPEGTFQAKFYGLGSDGTVGANKNSIKIIGETTNKYCQAYFAYDSKKSGGVTISHLRFGDKPIRSTYLVTTPDFVACHVLSYLDKYDMLRGLKKEGTFLLNTIWSADQTKKRLPDAMKKYIADNNINFYIINATKIAEDLGLGNRTNTIMQASFFKISEVIDYVLAEKEMKKMVVKSYSKKGEEIVKMNNSAIDRGTEFTKIEIPAEWKNCSANATAVATDAPEFISKFVKPVSLLMGDDLPVSIFKGREDGTLDAGTAAYEKRSIAVNVPEWVSENCIQCNQCSYVCPHAVIRPFLLNEQEASVLPAGTKTLAATGSALKGLQFRMQVSVQDCTGCGNCAERCPAKTKALVMKPIASQEAEIARWNFVSKNVSYKDTLLPKDASVKNSQFSQPLFEFSGACGGCGETPYVKLITQLFGDRMMVANATGCSSIYGGSSPSSPYCKNSAGKGPAWANSLFEDNAEYGFGMATGVNQMRDRIVSLMTLAMESVKPETKEAFAGWIADKNDAVKSKAASEKVLAAIKNESAPLVAEILTLKDYLIKKSIWIFGGDGWAYDIGFGGLDHVIASGEDVNILVLDTEVYSNTGGQASKSTPVAAVAKFAAAGKRIRKKDLGMIAMSYGYVYVAQVNMGANQSQYLKALREAEAYAGPSLIIAYSPCINQGFRNMGNSQLQAEMAAECGYWHLYRYNPLLEKEGKNPFQLDSKAPDWTKFQQFLQTEVRYSSLKKALPNQADELFKAAEVNAQWRYNSYVRMSQMNFAK